MKNYLVSILILFKLETRGTKRLIGSIDKSKNQFRVLELKKMISDAVCDTVIKLVQLI